MKKFLSVLLAVMMVLSTVSFAAPSIAGSTETAVEIPAVDVPAVEDADLSALITDNTDHGELVFELNFDNLANGTAIANNAKLNTLGATLSSNIAKANDLYLVLSQYGSAVVENGALKAVKTGTGRWPQIQVSVGTKNSLVDNGIIYMEARMKLDLADTQTTAVSVGLTGYREYLDGTSDAGTGAQASVQTINNAADETWYDLKGAYALNDTDGATGLECVICLPTYAASSAETDYYYLDYVRLYYKPFNAKVTLTSDAEYLTLPEAFTVSTTESILVSELVKDVEKASVKYAITGVKIDGTEYAMTDSVVITKDCEVEVFSKLDTEYANEWLDDEHGILLFKTDFDSAAVGSINILGTDNEDAAAFTATSEVNPYFSEYSSMEGTILLGDAYAPENAEIVYDEVLESNVLKFTASQSYSGLMYSTPYNQRNKCDLINSSTGVLTIVHKQKAPVGATYRYNGWINNSPGTLTYNDGGDDSQDSQTSTDLGNGYSEWVGVYNMVDGFHIDSFKIHLAGATAGDVAYFDDIEVFWKPATANITFADCDVKGVKIANKSLTNVSTSTTVSALLTAAGVDYSEVSNLSYTFKGVSFDAEGTKVYGINDNIGFYEDSTLYLVFEKVDMSDWSNEKGILLFDLDFSDAKAAEIITASTNSSNNYGLKSMNAKVNPYIAGSENWYLMTSGMKTVGIENGAFKFQWDGTGRWPQILVGNSANTSLVGENGTYSVHAEIKVLAPKDANLGDINITANGFVDGVHKGPSGLLYMGVKGGAVADEWFTIEGSKSTWDNDTDGIDNDDINKITTVFNYSATTGTAGGMFLMDNIKLYWKPSNVDVTIEGGVNEAFEAVELKDVSTTATVAEIIAMIPNSATEYGKITGLADENGNKITTFSAITDVTLQPLWTPWVVVDGGQEFPVEAKGVSGGGSGQWSGSYGNTNDVGNGGGQVTAAISWMYGNGWYTKDGNLYRVQDTVAVGEKNTGATNDPATWATPAVHSDEANGTIRDNIITTLAANNDAEYVLVKYRYTNLPDLAEVAANDPNPEGYKYTLSANGEELTYYDRTGATQTFDMSPAYGAKYYIQRQTGSYSYGGGEEFRKNELFVEGEWLCDFLPVTADMKTEGVKQVIIQRYNLFDQMVTEYDYVRFVKLGEESAPIVPEQPAPEASAPATDTEKASIRVDSPMGIRFRATLDNATAVAASDYGWVVARKTVVENAGFALTDVTVDQEAFKVIVGYGRENSVDLKQFFESTDTIKTFTAVVYNLPEGMEQDILVARPFVKVDGEYMYGEPAAKSIYEVACAIRDGGYDGLSDYHKGKINAIIAAVK